MYARNIKIYKGVDNLLRLSFVNQDQKNISILGKTIRLQVFHPDKTAVLNLAATTTDSDGLSGIAYVTFTADQMATIPSGLYNYAVVVTSGEGDNQVAYADDNYGAGGVIELIDGHYPVG